MSDKSFVSVISDAVKTITGTVIVPVIKEAGFRIFSDLAESFMDSLYSSVSSRLFGEGRTMDRRGRNYNSFSAKQSKGNRVDYSAPYRSSNRAVEQKKQPPNGWSESNDPMRIEMDKPMPREQYTEFVDWAKEELTEHKYITNAEILSSFGVATKPDDAFLSWESVDTFSYTEVGIRDGIEYIAVTSTYPKYRRFGND